MKPRFTLLTAGLLFTAATLAACRREVPAPRPGQDTRPSVLALGGTRLAPSLQALAG